VARRSPTPVSLPKNQRLRSAEFQAIFQQRGQRVEYASFNVVWRRQPGEPGKVGFAVGRRLGRAVERNRARRRLREAYRLGDRIPPVGVDVVFVGRAPLLKISFRRLIVQMRDAMHALDRVVLRGKDDLAQDARIPER